MKTDVKYANSPPRSGTRMGRGIVLLVMVSSTLISWPAHASECDDATPMFSSSCYNDGTLEFSDVRWNGYGTMVSGKITGCPAPSGWNYQFRVEWGGCGDIKVSIFYHYRDNDGQISTRSFYQVFDGSNAGHWSDPNHNFRLGLPSTATDFWLIGEQATCVGACLESRASFPACSSNGLSPEFCPQTLSSGGANVVDATGFMRDCDDDGEVVLVRDLTVDGGYAEIPGGCAITLKEGVTLTIQDATLTSENGSFIIGNAVQGSRLVVLNSTIAIGGAVQFSPGCCAGKGEIDRSEASAYVTIVNSNISGHTVEVTASTADDSGTTVISGSTLRATAADLPIAGLGIGASISASHGHVSVSNSRLLSESGIVIRTGDGGHASATGNLFAARQDRTRIISRGSCSSTMNVPATACTFE
ncbi:MAG: hypothetical protein ABIS18_00225 [Actinomycetota bacterium]